MKLLSPSLLILLLCRLGTSVSDKSSLTFVDLISGIISDARSVTENLVNWKLMENESWPRIDLNRLPLNINQSNCTQDLQIFARDLVEHRIWALKSNLIK